MAAIEKSYREYFNINPDYFPQVNEAIIQSKPDYWKLYYPHETFVRLLNDTVKILSRREKLSIWVEGAYGTGKSHAVLTLKNLYMRRILSAISVKSFCPRMLYFVCNVEPEWEMCTKIKKR